MIRHSLGELVDASSSVCFRVVTGATISYWAWDYLSSGIVTKRYIEPRFHFTYYPLDFLRPLPGQSMYLVFLAIIVLGLLVAAGAFYRIASALLAIAFTYVFLLDRTNYQNHYYLISLICWWLPFLPLHRMVSFDAWRDPSLYSELIPQWVPWVLRFHIGLPYFMGGIAKCTSDWLLGFPMNEMMLAKKAIPFVGPICEWDSIGVVMAWGGLLFDLLIVAFLLWPKTRFAAYIACLCFHLSNSVLFNIHIFPWFMMAATPIFFGYSWPRILLTTGRTSPNIGIDQQPTSISRPLLWFFAVYCAFHVLWPLRHLAYPGDTSWHERGHYFAWRMMLRGKRVVLGFAVKDRVTSVVSDGNVQRYLSPEQQDRMGRDPEMILHFAHFLRDEHRRQTGNPSEVYALALVSLNGRKPQLMIDPNVDLAQEPRGFFKRRWILEQNEPLRWPPWNIPPSQWREHVTIPRLQFLSDSQRTEPLTGTQHTE